MSIERLHPGPRMSQAVIHNGVVYLAGQVAREPADDVADQARQVLAAIDALLGEAGSDKSQILSATIYLTDMADFAAMNGVWESWITAGSTPARATVEASLASPKYKIEIVVVAAVK